VVVVDDFDLNRDVDLVGFTLTKSLSVRVLDEKQARIVSLTIDHVQVAVAVNVHDHDDDHDHDHDHDLGRKPITARVPNEKGRFASGPASTTRR